MSFSHLSITNTSLNLVSGTDNNSKETNLANAIELLGMKFLQKFASSVTSLSQ